MTSDGRRSLAHGVVVEASVVGRVLGVRLLRLEAEVVIAPAETSAPAGSSSAAPIAAAEVRRLPPPGAGAVGTSLADAVRLIAEGRESLAAARGIPRSGRARSVSRAARGRGSAS